MTKCYIVFCLTFVGSPKSHASLIPTRQGKRQYRTIHHDMGQYHDTRFETISRYTIWDDTAILDDTTIHDMRRYLDTRYLTISRYGAISRYLTISGRHIDDISYRSKHDIEPISYRDIQIWISPRPKPGATDKRERRKIGASRVGL